MKKILLTIMVVAFVFFVTVPAMAKGAKPPKNLCIETKPGDNQIPLGIKKARIQVRSATANGVLV